ncbi:MAG: DUF4249 family protein [Bacteroidia bacterium]
MSLLCILLLSACETDFDVTGDWKEIPVVYGILDKNDATHYIRINKAYLGDADAIKMGHENDSINYDSLTVRLIELTEAGTAVDSFLLEETTVALEMVNDTGVFGSIGNPLQKLWKTTETLDQTKIYRIKAINEATGNIVTAEAPIVKSFTVSQPSASPQSKISFIGNNDAYSSYSVKFAPAGNGKLYEVTIVFYYREINASNDTTLHEIRWKQSQYVADESESVIQINIEGENFFSYVGSIVDTIPTNYKRLIGRGLVDTEPDGNADDHIDIFINVGGEELYNYIEINKPAASGVLLDKPVYTNIENGLGIFSSRTSNSVLNKSLSVKSILELREGPYTSVLGFEQEND